MTVRLINQSDVRRVLSMTACIAVMREALSSLSRGDATSPLRWVMMLPDGQSAFAMMPAYAGGEEQRIVGAKVITAFNANHGTPYDSHQGVVLLFEAEHGQLVAIVDATAITTVRTAAVSAVATDALAREGAAVLAILGAGVQARSHVEAMCSVRPVREIRIWSRSTEHARTLAAGAARECPAEIRVAPTAALAVRGADVVCTTTSSRNPVLEGAWLSPGAHVNAVGACVPFARELDTTAVTRARLYVDRRESALREPGDILEPLKEGAITAGDIVAELGDVLTGRAAGRKSPDEITLFKSLGLAIEDLAAAAYVHRIALAEQIGTDVELGGHRERV